MNQAQTKKKATSLTNESLEVAPSGSKLLFIH